MAETNTLQQMMPSSASFCQEDMLRFVLERDNLTLDDVLSDMRKAERQKIIASHPYKVFQGKDGRWHTCFKDDSKKDGRRHIAKTTLDKLNDAIVEFYKNEEEENKLHRITVEKLYPDWLEYKKLHTNSEAYINRIGTEWEKYYKGTNIIKVPIADLDKLTLDIWAHGLIKDNNMTKKQYYNTTMIMRQVLHYAVDKKIIAESVFDRVRVDVKLFRKKPKPPSETQVFTSEEVDKLHDVAWEAFYSRRNRKHQLIPLAVMFFFQTGMRISEICAVRYGDIEGNELHVQRMYNDYEKRVKDDTKGRFGDRFVPLTDTAMMLIDAARERQKEEGVSDSGYIFSMTDDPLYYDELRKTFEKYCTKAGIAPRSSHKSRKTVISTLIDNGVNINTIREMMGQKDERTTYENYCFDRKEKNARYQLISNSLSRSAS